MNHNPDDLDKPFISLLPKCLHLRNNFGVIGESVLSHTLQKPWQRFEKMSIGVSARLSNYCEGPIG